MKSLYPNSKMLKRKFLYVLVLAFGIYLLLRCSPAYETPGLPSNPVALGGKTPSDPVIVLNQQSGKNETKELCVVRQYDYKGVSADDPQLVNYIRQELLDPPSLSSYALSDPSKIHFSQYGQSEYAAEEILRGMRGGFFIEAGALDGEYLSNTLYFERELGWRGLLIEPHPEAYKQLRQKHRNAFSMNVALSTTPHATEISFVLDEKYNELSHIGETGVKIKGIPFYSILLALEIKVVDFLSLDVEAFEMKILQTIPWDKVTFRLMCIEIDHIPEGVEYLKKYLTEKGYEFLGVRNVDAWFGWPSLLEETKKPR
ncbi:protein Star-like [Macrobrachium rosenbergii]|uniref:protein Star-like n=1 Tax=Macrobrachium rosenbergii TaxID=79674 RepID=UPI0034D641C2